MAKEGWTWLENSTKRHYFVQGRSLCKKWAYLREADLKQGDDDRADNCATCRRKLKSRKGGE